MTTHWGQMDVYSYDAMTKLSEEEFRLRVLIPLLKKLGYIEVKDWHGGSSEQGKDILCSTLDELKDRKNLAIVAKAVNFGKNSARQDVCAQVAQSFSLTFLDKETGEEQIVHDCWIVTNKNIAVGNNTLLRGTLKTTIGGPLSHRVKILDGRDVWDQVVQHFPVELSQAIQAVTERIDTGSFATQLILGEVERPIARFTLGDKTVVIGEKQSGQLEDEPFNVSAAFAFPDDEAGRSKAEELRGAIEGRGSAFIPGEYIKRFDIPETALEHASTMLGAIPEELTHLEITPVESRSRILVSLELAPDEGEPATLPYLDMLEQSRMEAWTTYTNEHQPIPTLVTLKLNPERRQVTWSVSLRPIPVPAPLYLNHLKFIAAGDRAGEASVMLLDPCIPWGSDRYPGRATPQVTPEEIDWVVDLALVQARTGVPIYVPYRDLTDAEKETIRFLRFILRNPIVPQSWNQATLGVEWTAEQAREMLSTFTNTEEFLFRAVETRYVELFGATVPLGRVEQIFTHTKLTNESDLRRRVGALSGGEVAELTVSIVPGSSNHAEARHLDWGALTKEEEVANENSSVEAVDAAGEY